MKYKILITVILILYLLLSGCAPGEQFAAPTDSLTPEIIITAPTPTAQPQQIATANPPQRMEVTPMPERIPTGEFEQENGITGEAPEELVERIISDLQQKTGAARDSIQVIRSQAVVWNDGSFGCPKPGEFYTQALVNGFHIILKIGDKEYDYRASQTGYFFLCEGGARLIPTKGSNDSL